MGNQLYDYAIMNLILLDDRITRLASTNRSMSLFVLNNYRRHRVHRTDQPSIPASGDFLSFFTTASTSVLPSNSASLFFLDPDPPGTPSVKGGGAGNPRSAASAARASASAH